MGRGGKLLCSLASSKGHLVRPGEAEGLHVWNSIGTSRGGAWNTGYNLRKEGLALCKGNRTFGLARLLF